MDARRALLTCLAAFQPADARACAVCFGISDGNTKRAFIYGIVFLGVVVMGTLAGVTAMLLHAVRRNEGR